MVELPLNTATFIVTDLHFPRSPIIFHHKTIYMQECPRRTVVAGIPSDGEETAGGASVLEPMLVWVV